ncbi:MAG: radical SAM protein [Ignavibacteria bacterium]
MYKLKYIALHITDKCSHFCNYCYYCGTKETPLGSKIKKDFPLPKLISIIDEIAKNNVSEIFLLGGDPAEHNMFLEIIKYASGKGLVITSVSNTHEYNNNLNQVAKYVRIFDTTIHGPSPEVHDLFCGVRGAYDMVLKNLKSLKNLGCSTGITINITPTNSNHLFQSIMNIVNSYGAILDYVNVQRIAPYGRAGIDDNYYLNSTNLLNALSDIEKIHNELNIEIQCEDSFPLCIVTK